MDKHLICMLSMTKRACHAVGACLHVVSLQATCSPSQTLSYPLCSVTSLRMHTLCSLTAASMTCASSSSQSSVLSSMSLTTNVVSTHAPGGCLLSSAKERRRRTYLRRQHGHATTIHNRPLIIAHSTDIGWLRSTEVRFMPILSHWWADGHAEAWVRCPYRTMAKAAMATRPIGKMTARAVRPGDRAAPVGCASLAVACGGGAGGGVGGLVGSRFSDCQYMSLNFSTLPFCSASNKQPHKHDAQLSNVQCRVSTMLSSQRKPHSSEVVACHHPCPAC